MYIKLYDIYNVANINIIISNVVIYMITIYMCYTYIITSIQINYMY